MNARPVAVRVDVNGARDFVVRDCLVPPRHGLFSFGRANFWMTSQNRSQFFAVGGLPRLTGFIYRINEYAGLFGCGPASKVIHAAVCGIIPAKDEVADAFFELFILWKRIWSSQRTVKLNHRARR